MSKCGTGSDHCCWFSGEQCEFLSPSREEGFKWQCDLRAKASSWEDVHVSKKYIEIIKPKWASIGMPDKNCGDWPYSGQSCNDCGECK